MADDEQKPTKEQTKAAKAVEKDPEGVAEKGNAQVQEATDEAEEKGYRGVSPDPTPRDHYTVAGVTAGKPTPETDPELAEKAAREVYGDARGKRAF